MTKGGLVLADARSCQPSAYFCFRRLVDMENGDGSPGGLMGYFGPCVHFDGRSKWSEKAIAEQQIYLFVKFF